METNCDFCKRQWLSSAILRIKLEKSQHIDQCYRILSGFVFACFTACLVGGVPEQREAEKPALPGGLSYPRRSAFSTEKGTLITTGYNSQVEIIDVVVRWLLEAVSSQQRK